MTIYNQLSYCLQSHEDNIIITLLIDGNPLYDTITCKQADSLKNKEDVQKFLVDSYSFEMYPKEIPSEETLFYYSFPENLMPVDPKHSMIGLDSEYTFALLVSPFLDTNEFNLTEEKNNDLKKDVLNLVYDEHYVCLSHNCGSIDCSNIQMKIERNQKLNTITFHSFKIVLDLTIIQKLNSLLQNLSILTV